MCFVVCNPCLTRPLVDQDLCKLHIICVNLHIFPPKHKSWAKNVYLRFAFFGMLQVMEQTKNTKTQIIFALHMFCVKLTQIYENYTNLLDEDHLWSKSQITNHKSHVHIISIIIPSISYSASAHNCSVSPRIPVRRQ